MTEEKKTQESKPKSNNNFFIGLIATVFLLAFGAHVISGNVKTPVDNLGTQLDKQFKTAK